MTCQCTPALLPPQTSGLVLIGVGNVPIRWYSGWHLFVSLVTMAEWGRRHNCSKQCSDLSFVTESIDFDTCCTLFLHCPLQRRAQLSAVWSQLRTNWGGISSIACMSSDSQPYGPQACNCVLASYSSTNSMYRFMYQIADGGISAES